MLDDAIDQLGLIEHAGLLRHWIRPAATFKYGERDAPTPVGASRLGGLPELPASVDWPADTTFFAQFDLAAVPNAAEMGLPAAGHLWLFMGLEAEYDAPVTAIHRGGDEPLAPRPRPEPEPRTPWSHLRPVPLTCRPGVSLPWSRKCFTRDAKAAGLPDDVLDQLDKALLGKLVTHASDGKLGGHSMQDEWDLHREIAYEKLGKPDLDASSDLLTIAALDEHMGMVGDAGWAQELEADRPDVQWLEDNADQISAEADRARLLCSFDASLGVLDLGDGMHLDFFIDADDLAAREFGRVRARLPMLL